MRVFLFIAATFSPTPAHSGEPYKQSPPARADVLSALAVAIWEGLLFFKLHCTTSKYGYTPQAISYRTHRNLAF